jgi:microcystin-dependent protein
MAEAFIGEIRLVGFNFAPQGWALCDGQLLSISQNTALFSLLGTYYGGNGQTTFALPDLRGRVPVHQGQGPGLSNYVIGQQSGSENVTLNVSQLPAHNHSLASSNQQGSSSDPSGYFPAVLNEPTGSVAVNGYLPTSNSTLNPGAIELAGGNQPHPNLQPLLCVNFIICLQGIYPSRS